MGTVMPVSRLEHITSLARREISHLRRNDSVVIWGGTNDISRNESDAGLSHMRKFSLQNKHTNIIAVTPSHRHDLLDFSCVNQKTAVFNRKLHKQLKDMHHVSMVDTNLTRDKFTRHGYHLNSSAKERIAKIVGQTITTILTSGNRPISLKWEEIPLATPTVETKMVSLTFWQQIFFFLILAHPVFKM